MSLEINRISVCISDQPAYYYIEDPEQWHQAAVDGMVMSVWESGGNIVISLLQREIETDLIINSHQMHVVGKYLEMYEDVDVACMDVHQKIGWFLNMWKLELEDKNKETEDK